MRCAQCEIISLNSSFVSTAWLLWRAPSVIVDATTLVDGEFFGFGLSMTYECGIRRIHSFVSDLDISVSPKDYSMILYDTTRENGFITGQP